MSATRVSGPSALTTMTDSGTVSLWFGCGRDSWWSAGPARLAPGGRPRRRWLAGPSREPVAEAHPRGDRAARPARADDRPRPGVLPSPTTGRMAAARVI